MNLNTLNDIASELFVALREQKTIQPLTDKYPEMDIKDAYKISRKFLSLREAQGEKVIGKKIGVTSPVVQEMLGVNQPDFGFLTNKMYLKNASNFLIENSLIQPRAEAEIAFILKEDIQGPGISKEDVILATGALMIALTLQVGYEKLTKGSIDKKLLLTWLLVVVLGGATLALRDPIFIQWKVSIVNWHFAIILIGFSYFKNSYLIKNFTEKAIPEIPEKAWKNATNLMSIGSVSYTHLTLPTNREV